MKIENCEESINVDRKEKTTFQYAYLDIFREFEDILQPTFFVDKRN